MPYGSSRSSSSGSPCQIAEHLLALDAKLLVVACNTLSAAALGALQDHARPHGRDVDMIGVLAPAAQQAVAATRTGRIGLLATPATVTSGAYERTIRAADPHVLVRSVACQDLAT